MSALLRLTAGLIWWAAIFSLLYAAHGLSCSMGWDARPLFGLNAHVVLLLALWLLGLAGATAILLRLCKGRAKPLHRAAHVLAIVGLGAIAVGGLPVLFVPACQ